MPPPPLLRLLCGALACLLAACGGEKKSDPATAARTFLEQVIRGETGAAYHSAAFGFQSQQSEKAFEATAREIGLVGGTLESLEKTEEDAGSVKFNARLGTAPKQEQREFVINVQSEGGAWRVFSVRTPRNPKTGVSENPFSVVGKSTAFDEAMNKPLPSERELRRLVREAMAAFAEAVNQRTFSGFYQHVSNAWQAQLTEKQLQRAFQGFIDQNVNLGGVADTEPVFDTTPQVTTDGLLLISGHYPTRPYEVYFAFKFIYELPEWKLFGVDVYLRKVAAPAAAPATPGPAAPAP